MTHDAELEDARHMDREHPDPDMSVGYEEALVISRIEMEICRCPQDEKGQVSPYNVNDLCEAHGGAIHRAIEDGRFWAMDWPWGELPTERLAECVLCRESLVDKREPAHYPASPEHDRRQDAHDREHAEAAARRPAAGGTQP